MSQYAHPGNDHAEKLKTDELKREVYKDYCDHIAKGYPQQSWYYDKDGLMLTANSMENYFKRYPELCKPGAVFDPVHKEVARSKNYQGWFDVSAGSAKGTNEKANTASLQMIMRNVHGWDKNKDEKKESSFETDVQALMKKWGKTPESDEEK